MKKPPYKRKKKKQKKTLNQSILIFIYLLIAIALIIGYYLIIESVEPNIQKRGLFGDTFGAVAALFSGCALIGVIVSLYYQRQDLRLQREEMQLTRNELERAADAQEDTRIEMGEQVRAMGRTALVTAYTYLAEFHDKKAESYKGPEQHHYKIQIETHETASDGYRKKLTKILREINEMLAPPDI